MSTEVGALIRLEDVEKIYMMGGEPVHALAGVSLTIESGEYVAITGASGSGKSTMMHIIGCLDVPTSGRYLLDGDDIQNFNDEELARTRNGFMGFVFQAFHLLPRVTALENVELGLLYAGVPTRERHQRAAEALRRVGLEARMRHRPHELSGGQQQRVAIARALVNNPRIVLADEPTGALDSHATADILDVFQTLHEEGRTVIIVTHEAEVAQRAARQVQFHDGRVRADSVSAPHSEARA